MRTVWWNGNIVDESEARISIYDSAFMFGDTCFEMTRSFNKVHFKLREHLERLMKSVNFVRIPMEMTIEQIEKACNEITEANQSAFEVDDEYRLMVDVTRGLLPRYEQIGSLGTNVIISIFPLRWATRGMGKFFDTGVDLKIPSQRQIPAQYLDPKIKHRSRLHFRMALNECEWPLLLDDQGFTTEGPGYNFLIYRNGFLITEEGRNILRGISRDYILCQGHKSFVMNIEPYDVYEADEAFITGTPFCILPVRSLNGVKIGDGSFRIYNQILSRWSTNMGVDIRKQIQAWDNAGIGVFEHRIDLPLQQDLLDVR